MLYTNEAINKRLSRDKRIKKSVSIIIYIILSIMLLYNVSLIFQAIIFPNKTPKFFGIKTYIIISRKYGARNKCWRHDYCKRKRNLRNTEILYLIDMEKLSLLTE